MTFMDIITADLKASLEAMEHENWRTAGNMLDCAEESLEHLNEEERAVATLKIARMRDTLREMKANEGNWLAQWYACGAGATSVNDAKAGRCKTVRV